MVSVVRTSVASEESENQSEAISQPQEVGRWYFMFTLENGG